MKASDIVKTLAALALMGGCPAAAWQQLLMRLAGMPLTGLSESDLQQVFQTYLLLKSRGTLFEAVHIFMALSMALSKHLHAGHTEIKGFSNILFIKEQGCEREKGACK